jgi:hypothetical protein
MDTFKEICRLLEKSGATICFCTLCSHDPKYGHCYACNCGNHVPEPKYDGDICAIQDDRAKLKATADHLKRLLKMLAEQKVTARKIAEIIKECNVVMELQKIGRLDSAEKLEKLLTDY